MKESQLDNKTTIATNDYVRMVDENNNSVKIKKDSFMAAIRDALPSIISDGETGGGSVLSIINGALKSRTDANLASVLGGCKSVGYRSNITVPELAKEKVPVIGMTDSTAQGIPVSTAETYGVFAFFPARYDGGNYLFSITLFALFDKSLSFKRFFVRGSWSNEGTWKEVPLS